jgi:hypothetical protein
MNIVQWYLLLNELQLILNKLMDVMICKRMHRFYSYRPYNYVGNHHHRWSIDVLMIIMDVEQFVLRWFYVNDRRNQIQIDLIHVVQMMIEIGFGDELILIQLNYQNSQLELMEY